MSREAVLRRILESDRKGRHSILMINWYLNEKGNLRKKPSYTLHVVQANLHTKEVSEHSWQEGDELSQVVFTGLEPDTSYRIWRFNFQNGDWESDSFNSPVFKTEVGKRWFVQKMNAGWVIGVSKENEGEPTSYHYFPSNNVSSESRLGNDGQSQLLDEMYPPAWSQIRKAIPIVEVN
ncbi:hypothetical protein ACH42_00870 [Endozoicomonas sp. (ex Bugula neritina AB1)]|nr:hypothetical protein ACH42_00870 [Endozoicomonas sp. (ex Bugula neritina AB1)]